MNSEHIKVCKRVKNNKRGFLILNEAQCKHMPYSPALALRMFDELSTQVCATISSKGNGFKADETLIIGFAETATAIGHRVATSLGCHFLQTTREAIESKVEVYNFEETHSHAPEQKLRSLDKIVDNLGIKLIILIDDEVTTGNTALHLLDCILEDNIEVSCGVASLISSMTTGDFKRFANYEITTDYVLKLDSMGFADRVANIVEDGEKRGLEPEGIGSSPYVITKYSLPNHRINPSTAGEDDTLIDMANVACNLCSDDNLINRGKILCLGTEECMYPAIMVGEKLQTKGYMVRSQSTTRSEIVVSKQEDYPLHSCMQVPSVYDKERVTFLYNIEEYDKIFIFTDGVENIKYLADTLAPYSKNKIAIFDVRDMEEKNAK